MSVAQRPAPPAEEPPEPAEAAHESGVPPLAELLQRARSADGGERARLCTFVNRALAALDQDPREACLLLDLLENDALGGLVDEEGVSCRAAAVEALLTLGYPRALELEPRDLAFLRSNAPRSRAAVWGPVFSGIAGVATVSWLTPMLVMELRPGVVFGAKAALALAPFAVNALSSLACVFGRPFPWLSRWALGLSSLACMSVGLRAFFASPATRPSGSDLLFVLLFALTPVAGLLGAVWPRRRPG